MGAQPGGLPSPGAPPLHRSSSSSPVLFGPIQGADPAVPGTGAVSLVARVPWGSEPLPARSRWSPGWVLPELRCWAWRGGAARPFAGKEMQNYYTGGKRKSGFMELGAISDDSGLVDWAEGQRSRHRCSPAFPSPRRAALNPSVPLGTRPAPLPCAQGDVGCLTASPHIFSFFQPLHFAPSHPCSPWPWELLPGASPPLKAGITACIVPAPAPQTILCFVLPSGGSLLPASPCDRSQRSSALRSLGCDVEAVAGGSAAPRSPPCVAGLPPAIVPVPGLAPPPAPGCRWGRTCTGSPAKRELALLGTGSEAVPYLGAEFCHGGTLTETGRPRLLEDLEMSCAAGPRGVAMLEHRVRGAQPLPALCRATFKVGWGRFSCRRTRSLGHPAVPTGHRQDPAGGQHATGRGRAGSALAKGLLGSASSCKPRWSGEVLGRPVWVAVVEEACASMWPWAWCRVMPS